MNYYYAIEEPTPEFYKDDKGNTKVRTIIAMFIRMAFFPNRQTAEKSIKSRAGEHFSFVYPQSHPIYRQV